MLGIMATMSLKNSEEALNSGKKEEAKQELLGVLDVLSEDCLDSELCSKMKSIINEAIAAIDEDKIDEAKQHLGTLVTLPFSLTVEKGS
jgi:ribosomal protein S20